MGDSVCEGEESVSRYFLLENVQIIESYNSSILHCSPFVFMGKHLIILIEWERITKERLEKSHWLDRDFEDEGCEVLHVFEEWLNAVKRHWNFLNSK
jgi:hypothetical protein